MIVRRKIIERLKWSVARVVMLATVFCCSACESLFDDEGDCNPHYFVRFVYDMNMLRSDAFAAQVNSVTLYVFDAKTGAYVTQFSDKGGALASGSYKMPLDIAPGEYELIAWCGLADNNNDFTVTQNVSQPDGLLCTMARDHDTNGAYSKRNLHSLFHGSLSVTLPDNEGEYIYTIKLTKDTNNINLSLQHTAGPLDADRFVVTMTDNNAFMAHDNSLLADEMIEYRPWSLRTGTLDVVTGTTNNYAEEDEDNREAGFLIAELSTARLMVNHDSRISIFDKEKGTVIFSIPLVEWALKMRSANHADMGEQEYLDREDEYNLMVFLTDDNKGGWMAMSIYINGWHLIYNADVEF